MKQSKGGFFFDRAMHSVLIAVNTLLFLAVILVVIHIVLFLLEKGAERALEEERIQKQLVRENIDHFERAE